MSVLTYRKNAFGNVNSGNITAFINDITFYRPISRL